MPREAWVLVKAVVSDTYPDNTLPGPQPPWPVRPPTGPVDPGYSPPWARPPQGPVDPGYSPPWAQVPSQPPYPDHSLPPFPSHPIYIPVPPPPESGLSPEHPIYIPVYPDNTLPGPQPVPTPPIMAPGVPGWEENQKIAMLQKVKAAYEFWTGNLPADPNAPPTPTPVA